MAFQFAIPRAELPAPARYACLYPATIACMVMMCMLRDRYQAVDRMLRAIHLSSYVGRRFSGASRQP
jgi:hypothetical protein